MCVLYGEQIMREFIFNENENIDLNKIAEELFTNTDSSDPASIYYKRHLERPVINWIRIILYASIVASMFIVLIYLLLQNGISFALSLLISFAILILYILVMIKKILICLVRIYQRFAPDSIRMKCRFEPSCSQYMIQALEKYGTLKGLKMGIKRLGRCKIGNGGYDFP